LPARASASEAALSANIADATKPTAIRNRSAMELSYHRRADAKSPIYLGNLRLGDRLQLVHLPAECFIEFQLHAQTQRPDAFIAAAAYGDGGPWYLPTAKAFTEGGYEPSVAFAEPEAETALRDAITGLVEK
jgi:hypothetical protein